MSDSSHGDGPVEDAVRRELERFADGRVSPLQIRRVGDVAVLTARVTNTAHVGDQQFDADDWTTDLVVRTGDQWTCVHTQITPAREPDVS